ncbi:MAG TPA: squalene/phytoene synthase family protein [Burkholderiaceae bacterium]|jgi:farnesyl-diphosphate farnesyltransferase|nr:squalene/phytoene synthase family protein [Burkholderiaceae bacterium]
MTALSPSDSDALQALLQKTSRTFALTIPMLPQPLRVEIGVAYLLFRIIDTFEDATAWAPAERKKALSDFGALLADDCTDSTARAAAEGWLRRPPVDHDGYRELLAETPRVLGWYRHLSAPARAQMRTHVERSAQGLSRFVDRADAAGVLKLDTMADLHDYCYVVAGIVGEMLTELFVLGDAHLNGVADQLRARAVAFGEGLQLVNILKDANADAVDGRTYLPRQAPLGEVFLLARADLRQAAEYIETLRAAGADRGLVAFNALNASLAIATLRLLRDKGLGSKLTRPQVAGLAAHVAHALDVGLPLFDVQGLGPVRAAASESDHV